MTILISFSICIVYFKPILPVCCALLRIRERSSVNFAFMCGTHIFHMNKELFDLIWLNLNHPTYPPIQPPVSHQAVSQPATTSQPKTCLTRHELTNQPAQPPVNHQAASQPASQSQPATATVTETKCCVPFVLCVYLLAGFDDRFWRSWRR